MKSIRNRILIWVFVLFLVIWTGITYATYYQSRHEVEELFDSELAQSAGVLLQISNTLKLNHALVEPRLQKDIYGHRYEKKIAFQIFDHGELVLYSANAPGKTMSSVDGFSDQLINHQLWRVFRLNSPEHGKLVITAEEFSVRDELVFEITQNSLYPLTLMIPILLFIIWLGIARGLSPIKKLARHITLRSPNDFSSIGTGLRIPLEIQPLVTALNDLLNKLSLAFDRERRFTSDAAHELQTPLASIKTQAQVALRAGDQEELRHALAKINDGVSRATHMIQQLLSLARIEPASDQDHTKRINLTELLQQTLVDFDTEAHRKNIEMTLEASADISIQANPVLIQMLFGNLLSNAIRYSPEHGDVSVKVLENADEISLCICDSGPGISEEEKQRIFERFYRGPNNQHIIGSGLGMSIVQRIVRIQNATIELANNPQGTGLRVCVQFPTGQPQASD